MSWIGADLRDGSRRASLRNMSREAFLYVEGSEPLTKFRDLERVATTLAATADDGRTVPAGSQGTIVDVIKGGVAYAVEFSHPIDTLATLLPNELRSLEDVGP